MASQATLELLIELRDEKGLASLGDALKRLGEVAAGVAEHGVKRG